MPSNEITYDDDEWEVVEPVKVTDDWVMVAEPVAKPPVIVKFCFEPFSI